MNDDDGFDQLARDVAAAARRKWPSRRRKANAELHEFGRHLRIEPPREALEIVRAMLARRGIAVDPPTDFVDPPRGRVTSPVMEFKEERRASFSFAWYMLESGKWEYTCYIA